MAVPFANLIPQRSRVLPQGGAVLGQLTGTFQAGLEQGRMRAAEDQAPDLLLNYLSGQAGAQPTLGNLAAPATGYVGGQQAPAAFDGRPTIANAERQAAATGGVDAGVQLLDRFEGFRATPYEDWSYRPGTGERYMSGMRIGYGQTIPGAQNITEEQAQAALRQQIEQQYIPSIVGTVGADTWGRLNPDQQGVLISLAHNYGSIPGRIVPALQSGDSAAAAAAIAALGGDNSGINQRRREAEAMAFAGTGQPIAGGAPAASAGGGFAAPQQQAPAWSPPTGAERAQLRALMINPATRQMGYQLAVQRMTPPEPVQPNWQLQEFNGTLYRVDANTGQAQPVIQGQPSAADRPTAEDQNGVLRYRDTGEPVFPNVQTATDAGFQETIYTPEQAAGLGLPTPPEGQVWINTEAGPVLRGASADAPAGVPDAGDLRTEIRQLQSYKNYYESLPIYQSMVASFGTDTKAADLNLVYGLAKIFDPTSVVREGEQVMVRNTASLPNWLLGAIDALNGEGALEPQTRQAIMAEAQSRVGAYQNDLRAQMEFYTGIATRAGLNVADLFAPLGDLPTLDVAPTPAAAAPFAPVRVAPPAAVPAAAGAPSPLIPGGEYDGPNGEVMRFDGTNFVDAVTGAPLYTRDGIPIGAN